MAIVSRENELDESTKWGGILCPWHKTAAYPHSANSEKEKSADQAGLALASEVVGLFGGGRVGLMTENFSLTYLEEPR